MDQKLGLIGAGNMAGAIIEGVFGSGLLPASHIAVSNRHRDKLEKYRSGGMFTSTDNGAVAQCSTIILLGIKPQMFPEVIPELAPYVRGKCVVSIAPGFSVSYLKDFLPESYVVRAMPNTPLQVGRGVTAVAEAPDVPPDIFQAVLDVFASAGAVTVVPEQKLNGVIALSGSSPAYFFRMANAMVEGGIKLGMDPVESLRLAALTMEGAARMLLETEKSANELTSQVCSPGGTTLAAMSSFDEFGFDNMIQQAMERCVKRADELGR